MASPSPNSRLASPAPVAGALAPVELPGETGTENPRFGPVALWSLLAVVLGAAVSIGLVRSLSVPPAELGSAQQFVSASLWSPGEPVMLGVDPIIARPAGTEVPYMVIVKVAVVGQPDDAQFEKKVMTRLERLRDAVTTELMETPLDEMQARGFKASLASQLRLRMAAIPGMESVQEILIPMFAVQ